MDVEAVNIWAVLVATGLALALAALWYSPALFGSIYQRETGYKPGIRSWRLAIAAILFAFLPAWAFAYWLGPQVDLQKALFHGLLIGVGFVASSLGLNYQLVLRSSSLWLIDGGYHVLQFLVYGLVFAYWPAA